MGCLEGAVVGSPLGRVDGTVVGCLEGAVVGRVEGRSDGAVVGSLDGLGNHKAQTDLGTSAQ